MNSLYDERNRLEKAGYRIIYSCYGITVKYQGQKIFDAPKTFSPGPQIPQHKARERQARNYLALGVTKAQAHEAKEGQRE